jgi:hypothetical protein
MNQDSGLRECSCFHKSNSVLACAEKQRFLEYCHLPVFRDNAFAVLNTDWLEDQICECCQSWSETTDQPASCSSVIGSGVNH